MPKKDCALLVGSALAATPLCQTHPVMPCPHARSTTHAARVWRRILVKNSTDSAYSFSEMADLEASARASLSSKLADGNHSSTAREDPPQKKGEVGGTEEEEEAAAAHMQPLRVTVGRGIQLGARRAGDVRPKRRDRAQGTFASGTPQRPPMMGPGGGTRAAGSAGQKAR